MNRLNEIEARANAATPGPWEAGCNDRHVLYVTTENEEFCAEYGPELYDSQGFFSDDDAEFIAHARADVPEMAAALRAVLELHVRAECPTCGSRDGEGNEFHKCDDDAYCEECDMEGYPCPTVETIRRHLGDDQ